VEVLIQVPQAPYQPEPPTNPLKIAEVQEVISKLNPKKPSGYDLITGKILVEHIGSGSHIYRGQKYLFLVLDRHGQDLDTEWETPS
jgi:hypothetical protein